MKSMGRLLLFVVPVLALVAFFIVMKQWGGIAPAAPVTENSIEVELRSPRTAQRSPTFLAPQPTDEPTLPPGMKPPERRSLIETPPSKTESPQIGDELEFSLLPQFNTPGY